MDPTRYLLRRVPDQDPVTNGIKTYLPNWSAGRGVDGRDDTPEEGRSRLSVETIRRTFVRPRERDVVTRDVTTYYPVVRHGSCPP